MRPATSRMPFSSNFGHRRKTHDDPQSSGKRGKRQIYSPACRNPCAPSEILGDAPPSQTDLPGIGPGMQCRTVADHPMDGGSVQGAFRKGKYAAGIQKKFVSIHTLRHSFAAHPPEAGVNIRGIGHSAIPGARAIGDDHDLSAPHQSRQRGCLQNHELRDERIQT